MRNDPSPRRALQVLELEVWGMWKAGVRYEVRNREVENPYKE